MGKLSGVDKASALVVAFVLCFDGDVFDELARAKVPELDLVLLAPGPCQDCSVVDVDCVAADVRAVDGADDLSGTDVPDLDGVVPPAREDDSRVCFRVCVL